MPIRRDSKGRFAGGGGSSGGKGHGSTPTARQYQNRTGQSRKRQLTNFVGSSGRGTAGTRARAGGGRTTGRTALRKKLAIHDQRAHLASLPAGTMRPMRRRKR